MCVCVFAVSVARSGSHWVCTGVSFSVVIAVSEVSLTALCYCSHSANWPSSRSEGDFDRG